MKGSEEKIVAYLEGSDKRFIIPVYQRNYDWKIENCKQLFDDLIKVMQQQRKSHFFGSLVSIHNDGEHNEYLVIDGQQRLTTLSLLLLAMYNIMKANVLKPISDKLADKLYTTYLIDQWQEDEKRIKLKPVKNDQTAFNRLFHDSSDYILDSNLTVNYNYFYARIQKKELSLDDLYKAISKLEIINISLSKEDDPQLIFESLNATGLALSEGDKIRNLILMGLPSKQQTAFYEKYWNKIEIFTNYQVGPFIRFYLTIKQPKIPSLNKIYITFKAYSEAPEIETESLLQELLRYATWYEMLIKGKTGNKQLDALIYRLNRLETTVTYPFFLEVLRLQEEGRLTSDEVYTIFLITETYLCRRMICELPTNALNKTFAALHQEILRYDTTDNNYLEKFKYALLSKNSRDKMPRDNEFSTVFVTRQIYLMNPKNKIYILERLENAGTIEAKAIYSHIDDKEYTIEHIMPQTLSPEWEMALGEHFKETHELWLHRIANLTLTGYNSQYSNASFLKKRDLSHGFHDSGLRMNVWIAQQSKWTTDELAERSILLKNQALRIWALPKTTYHPDKKQIESVSLDEDVDLSNQKISRFSYKNTELPVKNWIDMFVSILQLLDSEDPSILPKLLCDTNSENELTTYINRDAKRLRVPMELSNSIFIETNTSTKAKLVILRKIFKVYDVNPEDLTFYLREKEEDENTSLIDLSDE